MMTSGHVLRASFQTLDAGDTFSLLQVEELEGDEAGNIVQGGDVSYTWSVFVTCQNGIDIETPKQYVTDVNVSDVIYDSRQRD